MSEVSTQLQSAELGEVRPLALRADLLVVETGRPRPPGARISFDVGGSDFSGKVVSVRRPDARLERWEVTVKLFAPSKKVRRWLQELVERARSAEM